MRAAALALHSWRRRVGRDVVASAEEHLGWRLPRERRVRHDGVVLLDEVRNQVAHRRDGIEGVEVEPLVLERSPEGFNHGVRVRNLDLRQDVSDAVLGQPTGWRLVARAERLHDGGLAPCTTGLGTTRRWASCACAMSAGWSAVREAWPEAGHLARPTGAGVDRRSAEPAVWRWARRRVASMRGALSLLRSVTALVLPGWPWSCTIRNVV